MASYYPVLSGYESMILTEFNKLSGQLLDFFLFSGLLFRQKIHVRWGRKSEIALLNFERKKPKAGFYSTYLQLMVQVAYVSLYVKARQ